MVQAKNKLINLTGTIDKQSSVYETEPWGFVHPNKFLNQVICMHTILEPRNLLVEIKKIEVSLGRTKSDKRYGERCIDIDILFYDNLVMQTVDLVIPHPEIPNRRFVLEPLTEIKPSLIHPVYKMTAEQLLAACTDTGEVTRIDN